MDLKDVLHTRKVSTETERQSTENRRLKAENTRQVQIEKDIKEKEAKRLESQKAQIAALIAKHRACTPITPDKVNKSGTGNRPTQMKNRGQKRYNPNIRRQQRQAKSNHLNTRVQIPIKIHRMHY